MGVLPACMSVYHIQAWTKRVAGPLELESQMVDNHHVVLGMEPGPFERAAGALHH